MGNGLSASSTLQGLASGIFNYDADGTVRQLTSISGAVTDTYTYDAFGNLINSNGATPNNYLYRSEQYDSKRKGYPSRKC